MLLLCQIKTLTKPIANQLKSKAAHDGWIRRACLQYGRFHHRVESRAVLRLAGHDAKSVKPATDDAAVTIGATIFSEVFIFTTAAAILAFELNKKANDDEAAKVKKDAATAKEKNDLERRFQSIEAELASVTSALRESQTNLQQLQQQHTKKKGWI